MNISSLVVVLRQTKILLVLSRERYLRKLVIKSKYRNCLGTFEEIKSQDNFMQNSYIYVSHVIENTGYQHFTEKK